ncbi:MAG: response regulator [Bacteroidales bacterium]|nr:response regulator [Bacteroidales bacterium]
MSNHIHLHQPDIVSCLEERIRELEKQVLDHDALRKADIAARTAEEKYKILTSLLPEMIIETDISGSLTFANLKTIEVFEYGSDVYGKNLMDLIAPEDRERCGIFFDRIVQGEIVPESEYMAITRPGRRFPVKIHATRRYVNGRLTGLSIVVFDITKEKRAEQTVLNYQESMLFLSETALKFLLFSNEDDIFIFIGKSISKIVPKSVVIVFSYDQISNIAHIRYISGIHSHVGRIIEILGKPPEDFAIELPRKFKTRYLTRKTLSAINGISGLAGDNRDVRQAEKIGNMLGLGKVYTMGMSGKGNLYGGLLFATKQSDDKADTQDVDAQLVETFIYQAGIALHRKQIETELMKAKVAAEESDRLKSAFLANMSHEVRTPLNGILGLSQLLLKPGVEQETHDEYLRMIAESGHSLLSLIEDIMDISKIEAGQMKIKYKPMKINVLMDQLYSVFLANPLYVQKKKSNGKGIRIVCKKQQEDITILSDSERLQQIFVNLIGNALKFTQKGYVEFGYELKRKEILFYVKDTGIGIPAEKTGKIFDRFTQVDNTLGRKFGGSGLGLAISKGLVDLLNGKIWCESALGKGATVFFTVPYHPTSLSEGFSVSWKADTPDYCWEKYTILVVEDDQINCKIIAAMLRPTKVQLQYADTGRKAIDYVCNNRKIDLVLMDVHLPEMNGLEASRIILEHRADLRIIAQTANAMSDDKEKCIEAGCVDYISKPINMNDLFYKIAKYLPKKSSQYII